MWSLVWGIVKDDVRKVRLESRVSRRGYGYANPKKEI
jgi:hypothetical protein